MKHMIQLFSVQTLEKQLVIVKRKIPRNYDLTVHFWNRFEHVECALRAELVENII